MIKLIELQTKSDFFTLFKKLNTPAWRYLSEGKTRINFIHGGVGYGSDIAKIEGFARILWGAGPALNLLDENWHTDILEGIRHGTDPNHPEYWGDISDRDQRMVEMPAIALTLLYDKQWVWTQLSQKEKHQTANWLNQILSYDCADGNWQFFKILVGTVLEKLNCDVNQQEMTVAFQKIEDCYQENGWYKDSWRGRMDYYNPFAFHYYGLVYSKLCPNKLRSDVFKERARRFAKDYLHFFNEAGANIPFGRSMIYRFAASAFWVAFIYSEESSLALSEIKGIIVRNLRWWMAQPIFDDAGMLTLGYTYPQLTMTEPYNSTLSPYWCNKVFLLLDLPDNHPFWKVEPAPLSERIDTHIISAANLVAVHDHGHSFFLNAGQPGPNYHALSNEKYLKFAYSSDFGFSIPRGNQLKEELAMDSSLGIQRSDTFVTTSSKDKKIIQTSGQFLVRNNCNNVEMTPEWIASTWLPNEKTSIRTWLVTSDGWQVRIHKLQLDTSYTVYETGFAIKAPPYEVNETFNNRKANGIINEHGFSGILELSEMKRENAGSFIFPNTNLMTWDQTYLPGFETTLAKGTHYLASAVYAHPDTNWALDKWGQEPRINWLKKDTVKLMFCKKILEIDL